uniref:Uncharacterized protein n=1 Tax=Knipowitschia caucasica TaxID=637954 RepID=A0AAV2K2C2_KNICA
MGVWCSCFFNSARRSGEDLVETSSSTSELPTDSPQSSDSVESLLPPPVVRQRREILQSVRKLLHCVGGCESTSPRIVPITDTSSTPSLLALQKM